MISLRGRLTEERSFRVPISEKNESLPDDFSTRIVRRMTEHAADEPVPPVDAGLARHGGLSYLEIPAQDARRAGKFYADVLGWSVEGADTDTPKFMDPGGLLLGRWIQGRSISRQPGWMPYIYVRDVIATSTLAASQGGEVVKRPYAEGNLRVALIRDTEGNLLGLWQQAD